METINGDFERDGPPPPSPLTGCYLLIVVGEPHSEEHRDIVLQRIVKGLLSWNVNQCLVDLEKELELISEQALEGEEARHGERLIQFASENLVTEILIHPVISTLVQCMRNLLSSFTRHRHIIHAGYTFAANGSWALQDGTFSYADFAEAFLEIETQRVIHAYENGISLDLHCSQEGDWCKLPKESFTKGCNVRVNPTDVLTCGSPSITGFINYVSQFLIPMSLENLLQCSDVVGNIRFSRPTLYVFPGGQGDAALFGVNGFNMLLDGGFSRKACFWDFVRHLDRLDAVLMTRLNNSNIGGISSILRRKRKDAVYPHLGHFFCNIQDRKTILSPDGDKDRDPLLIDLLNEGQEIISNLHHLNLNPQTCYRDPEPINLYHKVGHGTLNMYVLNPAKDSKEVKEFIQRWNQCDQKLFSKQQTTKFSFPVQNLISIAVLLIWQPANISDTITRILYPGSSPQQKIFEGLERLKNIEFVKQPVCSEKSLFSKFVAKKSAKHDTTEKVILKDKPAEKKEKLVVDNNINAFGGEIKERNVKKSDSLESERARNKKIEENKIITENNEKLKMKTKKFKIKNDLQQRKKSVEKTDSPTTPKKSIDQEGPKKTITSTPAKSTKDANNRKVIENKAKSLKSAAEPRAKLEKKTIAKKPKTLPKTPISPAKRMTNGLQKVDRISDRQKAKLEKDGTTDSSTVSTPTADQDSLKKDISNLSSEQIQQLKAQELADLQEEQEAIKEIEAVFRKGEAHINGNENMRKVKSISIDEDKSEKEEYLIIEREETDFLDEKEKKEIEFQKLTKDSEESEKQKGLIIEDNEQNQQSIKEAKTVVKTKESVDAVTKDAVITSQEEKVEILSSEKKSDKEAEVKDIVESHPDEKMSANIKSGDTTTAPTLPEDERIPLDEIKEDNGYPIEEKYVREETKEKGLPIIQLPAKTFDSVPKTPGVVGIRLDKQSHIRDIVKTPDEVADLPVHEEVDYEYAHESKTEIKINDAIVENVKSNEDEMRESKGEEKEIVECPAKEIYEKADKEVMETKPKELLEEKDQEIDVKTTDLDVDKSQKQSVMKDKEIQSKEGESHRTDDIVKTEAAAKDIKQVLGTEQEIITKTEEISEDIKKLDQPHEEIQLKEDSKKKDILKFEEEKKDSDKNIIDSSSVKSEHVELTKGDIEQDKVIEHEIKEKSEPEQIKKKDTGTEEVCKSLQEEKGSDKSSTDTSSYKLGTTELTKEQTKQHEEVEEKQQKEKSHEMKDKSSVSLQIEKEGSTLKEISKVDEEKKDIEKSTTSSDISGETEHREQHEKVEEKPQEVKEESVKPEQIKKEDFEKEQSKEIEDKQHEMKEEPLASENVEKEDSKAKEISKSKEEEKVSDKRITEASSFKSGDTELSKEQTKHHTEIEEKQREMKEEPLIFKKMEKKVSKLKETSSSEEEEKTSDKSITETSSVKSGDTELSKELLGHDGKIEEKHEIKEEPLIFEKMGKKYFTKEEISKSEEVEENSDKSMVKEHTKQHEVEHKQYEEKPTEIKEMSSNAQQIEKEESTIKKISKFEEEKKDSGKSTTEISSGISGETEFTKEDKEQYEDIEQKPQELNEKSFVSEQIDQKDSNKEEVSKDEKTEEGSDKSIIQTKSNLTELSKEHTKQHQQIDEKLDETKDKLSISEQMKKEDIKPEEVVKFEQQIKDIDKSIIETQSFISAETELIKQHDLEGTEGEMKPHEIEEKISITQQIKKQAEQSDVTKDEMKEIPSILEKGIMEDSKIEEIHKFGEENESSDKSTTEISSFNSGETELAEKHTQQYEKDKLSEQIKEKESETEEVCKSEAVKKGGEIEEKPQQIQKEDSKIEQISKFEEEKKDSGKSFAETSSDISDKTEVKEKSPLPQQIENEDSKIEKTSKFDEEKYSDKIISEHTEEHEAIEEKAHGVKEVSLINEKRERKDSETPEISKSEEEKPTAISSSKPHGVKEESLISEKRERKDSETPEISKSEEEKPTAISSSKPHGVKEESLTSEKRERKDSETPEISKSEEEKPTAISSSKPHRVKEESLISEKRERKDSEAPEISKSEEEKPTAVSSSKTHGVKEESLISEKRERKESETPEISKSGEEMPTAISSSKPHGVKEESLIYEKRERKDSETPEISKSEEEKPTAISSSKPHGVKEESLISEKRERKESETPEISKSGEEMPTAISSSKPHGVKEESLISEKRERKDSETPDISKSEEEKPTAISSSKSEKIELIEHSEQSEAIEEKKHEEKEESHISEKNEEKDSKPKEISKSEEEEKASDKSIIETSFKPLDTELSKHTEHIGKIEEEPHKITSKSSVAQEIKKDDSKIKEISKFVGEEKGSDKCTAETSPVKSGKTELIKGHTEHYEEIEKKPVEMKEESSDKIEIKDFKAKDISKIEEEKEDSCKRIAEKSVKSEKIELTEEHTEHHDEIQDKQNEIKEESLLSEKVEKKESETKEISKSKDKKEKDSDITSAQISPIKSGETDFIKEHTEQSEKIEEKPHGAKEESHIIDKLDVQDYKIKEISKSEEKEKGSDNSIAEISPIKSGKIELTKEHIKQPEDVEEKPHGVKEESHISEKQDGEDSKIKDVSKSEEEKDSDKTIAEIFAVKTEKNELIKEHTEQFEAIEEKPHTIKEEFHILEKLDMKDSKIKEVSKSEKEKKDSDESIAEISTVKSRKIEHTEDHKDIEEKPHRLKEESHVSEKLDVKDSKIKEVPKFEEEKCDGESIAEISALGSETTELTKDTTDQYEETGKKPHAIEEVSLIPGDMEKKDSKTKDILPKSEEEEGSDKSIVETFSLKSGQIDLSKEHTEPCDEIKEQHGMIEKTSEEIKKGDSKIEEISLCEKSSDKSSTEIPAFKSEQIESTKEFIQHEKSGGKLHEMKEESTSEQLKKEDLKMKEKSKLEEKKDSETSPLGEIALTKEEKDKKVESKIHEMKEESSISEQITKEDSKIEFAEKDKQSKLIRDGLEEFEEKPQEIKDSVSEQIKKKEVEHSKETPKYEDDKIQPKEVKSEVLDKKTTAEQIIEEDLKTREADDDDTDEERSTDKIETVGKLPKEREEDVIKIVATVAEVLKSDAPLEEFEGKLPISFDACKTAYVTELRETHITTTELPDETGIPPIPEESSTSLRSETDEEIKKSFEEAVTIPKILPDDIKEALEKELSDIEDQKTVQRMLVTASSEDGGEEIEICPVGTIIFSKSSESSGRSSLEKSQESKKSSIVDTISDSLTTVKQYTEAELDADIGNVNSEQDYLISDDRTKDKEEVTSLGDMAIEQTDQKYLKEDMEDGMEDELQKEEIKEGEQKGTEISSYVRDEKLTGEVHLPEVCSKIVDGKEEEEMEDTKIKPHSEKDILSSSVEGIKDSSTSKVSETISDKTVEAKGIKEDSTVSEKPLELKSTEKVKDSVDVGIDEKRTAPTSDITTAVIDINGDHTLPEKELPIKPKDYVDMGQSVSDKVHTIAFRDIPEKSLDKKTEDHADRIIHEDSSPPTPPEKLSGLITKTEVDVAKPVDEDKKIISTSDISHSEKELPKKIEDHVDVDGSVDEDKKIASTSDKLHAIDFKGDKVHPEKLLEMGVTEVHADVIKLADKDKKSVPTSDVCSDPLDQKASESATETKKMDHTCEISDGSKTPIEKSEDEKERKEDKHDLVTETVTSLLGKSEKEGSSEIDMKSGSSKEIKQPVQESEIVLQKEIGREGQKQDDKDFKSQDKRDLSESVLQGKSIAPPPDAVSSDESGKSSVTKDVKEKPKTDSTPLDTFFEDSVLKDKRHSKDTDLMCESFYGTLPGDESEESEESQLPPSCLYELTNAKYISECSASTADKIDASEGEKSETEISKTADTSSDKIQKESAEAGECLDNKLEAKTSSLYLYELTKAKEYIRSRVDSESEKKADKIASWGKPLGLPSPAPMTDNKGTPKKERKLPLNISVKNKWNDDKKRSESPSKTKNKKLCPIYVDLTYVPHHGNSYYSYVDFFKLVRARYYVFSGTEPGREVYNALLEAKQTWDDKELEVTIIPTYDTDVLGYWVAENEELLTKWKIDLSPSASRCTINLQDHETSCSAYRLEF